MKASRARYGVIGFALTLAMLAYVQRVAISQAAGPISADMHLNKAQMGAIFGAFGLSYAIFEIPMGTLGDRLGVRRVLTQIVLLWSVFTALTGAAWNASALWGIRFLFGAGEAGCFPNLTKMLSVWLPAGERVKAQALMWAFTRWGGAVTPPLALLAITAFGWRYAFVAFGLMGVVWLGFFLRFFKDDPAQHKGVNAEELKLLEGSRAIAGDHSVKWGSLFLKPAVLVLVIQYFCFSFVWYFYVTWLPTYLKEAWSLTATQAAGYAVLPLLFGGFGSLISGLLPLKIPRRWVAFGGFAATAVLLFAVTRIHSVGLAMVAMAIASFCSDLTMPISWNTCVEIGRRYTATVAATMNMMGNLAGFVAPVVSGIILQRSGNDWNALLYVMVGSACISAVCWLYLDPDKIARRNAEAPLIAGNAPSLGTP
ncbi:MFS transporter [Phenylobacterium hankyongense]|uniref:MFS transporter n=1 Tax=Phenylobacterium hankyongense TaxID=1813876 RepID=A0A328B0G9_9CAUL|nr:MFS transporter [Phenylobacterium hankyongense]RAK60663.1 MFS transporter [Phenylobacterium hankyongense]